MTAMYRTTSTAQRPPYLYPVTCWTCQRPFFIAHHKPGRHHHACSPACRKRGFVLRASWTFWSRVSQEGDCWIWHGKQTAQGYGHYRLAGTDVLAHHFAYSAVHGPIPPGWHRDHLCRQPLCVHPAHLEPVTPRVNILRGNSPPARNAHKTHCPRGHAYTPDNTIWRNERHRWCRTCKRETDRRRHAAWRLAHPLIPPQPVTMCYQGHAYDEANTYWDRKGKRRCRACKRDLDRQRRLQRTRK